MELKLLYDEAKDSVVLMDTGEEETTVRCVSKVESKDMNTVQVVFEDGSTEELVKEDLLLSPLLESQCGDSTLAFGINNFIMNLRKPQTSPIKFAMKTMVTGEENREHNHDIDEGVCGKSLKFERKLIKLSNLQHADDHHSLRNLNAKWVTTLTKKIVAENSSCLSSELSVIPVLPVPNEERCYMVLDGNHRLEACKKIQDLNLDGEGVKRYIYLPCKIYTNLSMHEALLLAFNQNENATSALKTSDGEKVMLCRKIWHSEETAHMNPDERRKLFYKCTDAKLRGDQQDLQPILFIARLPEEHFELIKKNLIENQIKPGTLNPVRNLAEDALFDVLTEYEQSGYDRTALLKAAALYSSKKKISKTKKPKPVQMNIKDGIIVITQGTKIISTDNINIFGFQMEASILQKCLKKSVQEVMAVKLGTEDGADVVVTGKPKPGVFTDKALPSTSKSASVQEVMSVKLGTEDGADVVVTGSSSTNKRPTGVFTDKALPSTSKSGNKIILSSSSTNKRPTENNKHRSVKRKIATAKDKTEEPPSKKMAEVYNFTEGTDTDVSDTDGNIQVDDKDVLLHVAPLKLEQNDYVVIEVNKNAPEEQRKYPWMGQICKPVKGSKVSIKWAVKNENNWKQSGEIQSIQKQNIVAKFKIANIETMSPVLEKEINKLSGF